MRGARRQSLAVLIAITAVTITLAGQQAKAPPAQKKPPAATKTTKSADTADLNRDTTFSLLREAYNTSRDLTSEQRIPLLVEICQISASMNSKTAEPRLVIRAAGGHMKTRTERVVPRDLTKKQREKLRDWSEELFQLGDEFPSGSQLRLQAETAAARAMISVNPKRAVELLDTIDTNPDPGGWDPRLSVVSELFNELYAREGAGAIPDIRREALSLGDKGAYPYYAVLNLLNQVHDADVVRQFFADSVDYLRRGPVSRQELFGMVSLLSSDQIRKQLEDWQTQDAATQLVSQVREYMREQSDSSGGEPVGVRGLLMLVKNSLKRFAPDAVASLPDPADLGFNGGPHLISVNANARRNVPKASVPDESMQQLKVAFEASRTAVMKLNEDDIHEGTQMQQTIDRAVELGAELAERTIQSYAPEDHAYAVLVSSSELSGVAHLGAHINPAATLAAIRGIQDDELKTRLLLAVARTIEYLH